MKKDKIKLPRREWLRSPATKVKASAKVYSRKDLPQITAEELSEKKYRYCPICSTEMVKKVLDKKTRLVCNVCGFVYYQNPVPAAAVIIEKDGKILLTQRKFEPYALNWSLPSGFVEYKETPEECAKRETKEETGLEVKIKKIFNIYLATDDPRTHVVLVVYLSEIIGGKLKAGDDAIQAKFFSPQEFPFNIAFTAHQKALREYLQQEI